MAAGFAATLMSPLAVLLPSNSSSASPSVSSRRGNNGDAISPQGHVQGLRFQKQQQQAFLLCCRNCRRSRNSLPLRSCGSNSRTSAAAVGRATATSRTAEEEDPAAAAAASTSVCDIRTTVPHGDDHGSRRSWRTGVAAMLAAATISTGLNASAELNKFEAETRGEFGVGSAAQYGSADLRKTIHANENFRRANFTSADMREADFSGCPFNGAYMEKAVAYKTNFSGADLSDTLMDRMVLNEADFTNALLVRAVLTRSDLGKAVIDGADFSDAVLDLQQKLALCKYASGTNPVTGMDTRKSLGCGNSRRNAYGTPSAPELSAPPEKLLTKDGFCDEVTGLCKRTGLQ